MRGRWVIAAALAVLLIGAAGVVVTADSTDELEDELSLDELQQDGTSYSNSPDSVRLSDDRMFWMVHWPAGVSGNPGDPDDDYWRYLSPDATVDRNSVWLRSINVDEREEVTVHVAAYQVGEREVHDEDRNVTTTEQYASDVSVSQHNVTLNRGWVMEEIPLPHTEDEQEVTVWVEGGEEDLRWTFSHESVATTHELPFNSFGGLLNWSMWVFLLPFGVGMPAAFIASKRVIDRTGTGPGWGYGIWIGVFAITAMIAVASAWGSVTQLLVEYPYVMSLYLLAFGAVLMLETFEQHTKTVRFERDEIRETRLPSDETGVDVLGSVEKVLTVIDRPDGPSKVASKGLGACLARFFTGGAATLQTVHPDHEEADERGETDTWKDPMRCQADVQEGNVDMRVFVHPLSPEVVNYKPEGWEWEFPDLDDREAYANLASKVGLTLVAAVIGFQLFAGLGVILALIGGAAWVGLRPVEGHARVWPAPVHYRSARATSMHLAQETDAAETIEEEREQRIEAEISKEKEKLEAIDDRDSTLLSAQFEPDDDERASAVEDDERDRKARADGGDDEQR